MRRFALVALVASAMAAPAFASSYDDLNAGIQFYNFQQWKEAILELDKALAGNDLAPSLQFIAHYDRGRAYLSLSQFDKAADDYSTSLALRPDETQVLLDRSLAYVNSGKTDLAAADLDTLIARHPSLPRPYAIRAMVNVKRGQADKGREDIKALLKLLPENARRGNGIGILKWEVGQVDDAEDNFSYETSHGPNSTYAWLWYALTEVRLAKNVPRRSVPDYDKKAWPAPIIDFFLGEGAQDAVFAAAVQGDAVKVGGQVCEANFYVGEWLVQHHDQAAAKPLLTKAAKDCPTDFIEWGPAQMDLAGLP